MRGFILRKEVGEFYLLKPRMIQINLIKPDKTKASHTSRWICLLFSKKVGTIYTQLATVESRFNELL